MILLFCIRVTKGINLQTSTFKCIDNNSITILRKKMLPSCLAMPCNNMKQKNKYATKNIIKYIKMCSEADFLIFLMAKGKWKQL